MKSNEFVKPDEILTVAQRTLFKALVILFLIGAACSVITAAYMDLYNPGSSQAMTITDIAKSFMLFTVLSSIPLWIEKGIVIKKWVAYIDSITDQDFKRDEINKVLKSPSIVNPYKLDKQDYSIQEIEVNKVVELARLLFKE